MAWVTQGTIRDIEKAAGQCTTLKFRISPTQDYSLKHQDICYTAFLDSTSPPGTLLMTIDQQYDCPLELEAILCLSFPAHRVEIVVDVSTTVTISTIRTINK